MVVLSRVVLTLPPPPPGGGGGLRVLGGACPAAEALGLRLGLGLGLE
jgi:hypothetical protein